MNNLGIRSPESNIPLLEDILFKSYKTNEIVKKNVSRRKTHALNAFKTGFTYNACVQSTKNKDRNTKT